MSRMTEDQYWITIVDALASRATCDRGRSACVMVRDGDLLASGYVGSPPGFAHCDDVGHLWSEDGKHCLRTIHAEQNAVIRAARNGVSLKGSTVYCTMEPCRNCAMTLIGIGVTGVVARNAYHAAEWSREAFEEAGISMVTTNPELLYEPETKMCNAESNPLNDWCRSCASNAVHVCGIPTAEEHTIHICGFCEEGFYEK